MLHGLMLGFSNPHVLGLAAREVFSLQACIVLVEAREGVMIYPRLREELNVSMSGILFKELEF